MSAAEIIEIVDRHNFHRSNVAPTATDMLKMVSGDSITLEPRHVISNNVAF